MAQTYSQVDVLTRRFIRERLYSHFIQTNTVLWLLAGSSASNLDKLGNPDPGQRHGVTFGGAGYTPAQRAQKAGSAQHIFRYQKEETDAPTGQGLDDSSPVATKFTDDLDDNAETHWSYFEAPLRLRTHRLDMQMGDNGIGSLLEESLAKGMNKMLKDQNTRLMTDTMTETEQDEELWDKYLGLVHTISDGETDGTDTDETAYNYYARKLRTASGQDGLQANVVDVQDDWITTYGYGSVDKVVLNMVDVLRGDDNFGGVANKNPMAGDLFLTPFSLFNVLKLEAQGVHTVFDPGDKVPGMSFPASIQTTTASKKPMILYGQTYITYDSSVPAATGLLLTLSSIMFEVHRNYNFQTWAQGWQNKNVNDEGGQHYKYNMIQAKTRLTCFQPWLNTKIVGLEVA